MTAAPTLEIENLRVHFDTPNGVAQVVNDVNLTIGSGQIYGLVGESGSGKSITARSVLGILPTRNLARYSGSIRLDGEEILGLPEARLRDEIRGRRVAMVFQDPMTALNPVMRIADQLVRPIRRHLGLSRSDALARATELLDQVGIPRAKERLRSYPHELSGGQRQRIMIAIALSCDPSLLIADEPTTALDVTVQAQILDLFDTLRVERGLSILLVSHDLSLIAERADGVAVMYAGRIVESGPASEIFSAALHPYTNLLEHARPMIGNPPHTRLDTIPGSPPNLTALPEGCAFASRCPRATDGCRSDLPSLDELAAGRLAACFHPLETARSASLAEVSA